MSGIFSKLRGRVALVAVANEFQAKAEEGRLWMPYGSYPHGTRQVKGRGRRKIMQEWRRESAEAVSVRVANARAAGEPGIPVYVGHPDVPELASRYPDKGAHGWVTNVEVQDDGAAVIVEWNDAPPSKRFGWFSPYWDADVVSDDGTTVTAQVYDMSSIGLTNTPNILDFRLPNEAEPELDLKEETNPERKDKVNREQLIAKLGLPSDADDAAIEAALDALMKRAEDAEAKVTEAETAKTTAETSLADAETAKTDLETKLANERAARVDLLTQSALSDGRITPADLPLWKKRLTENFDTNSVALANERKKVKTEQVSDADRAIRAANDAPTRIRAINAAVEVKMASGLSYDSAHAAVRREQPELFKK